jgi:type I restriction enzyme M protein
VHGWTEEYLPSLVEDYEDGDMAALIEDCKQSIGYFIEYKNLVSTRLLPESTFSVEELSEAFNCFDRLISDNYKRVYEN